MAIKDILLLLESSAGNSGPYALTCASAFRAHLTAATLAIDAAAALGFAGASSNYLQPVLDEEQAEAHKILDQFLAAAQKTGTSVETEIIESSFEGPQQAIGQFIRPFDVVITQQPQGGRPGRAELMIEAALFGSGRPIIIVPYIQTAPFSLNTVLIAWDGSAVAARTLADATPLLKHAQEVLVVMIDDAHRGTRQASGVSITKHLARHCVNAKLKTLTNGGTVASTLLSYAADVGADLLVMGGYGHSRFREFVLGGTTRDILESLTLPVMMSH